jgi:hypothetical protein
MRTVAITLTKEFDNKANAESALEYIKEAAEARGWSFAVDIHE